MDTFGRAEPLEVTKTSGARILKAEIGNFKPRGAAGSYQNIRRADIESREWELLTARSPRKLPKHPVRDE